MPCFKKRISDQKVESLNDTVRLLIFIFKVNGIEVTFSNGSSNKTRCGCLSKFSKYLFIFVTIFYTIWVLFLCIASTDDRKSYGALIFMLVFVLMYISVSRSRRNFYNILKKVSGMIRDLKIRSSTKNIKRDIFWNCIFSHFFLYGMLGFWFSISYNFLEADSFNSVFVQDIATITKWQFQIVYIVLTFIFTSFFGEFFIAITLYYSSVCKLFASFYAKLLIKLNNNISEKEILTNLKYLSFVTKVMVKFENAFCSIVGIIIVLCMLGVFCAGCSLAFTPNESYHLVMFFLSTEFFFLYIYFLILIPGCDVVEWADKARWAAIACPGVIPSQYKELKQIIMKNKLNRKCSLTLWKAYAIDRSLVIRILVALFEYGILFGTIGKA